jgi:hypothetical protein
MSRDAAWWRDYRIRRGEELRAYNRERRRQPKVRRQRHASESRRRARIRAGQAIPSLHTGHPLFDFARAVVAEITPLRLYVSPVEIDRQDARSEAVLAMLEQRDPRAAAIAFLRDQAAWRRLTQPLVGERAA